MPLPDPYAADVGLQNLEAHLRSWLDQRGAREVEAEDLVRELDALRRRIDQHRPLVVLARQKVKDIEEQIVARRRSLGAGELLIETE